MSHFWADFKSASQLVRDQIGPEALGEFNTMNLEAIPQLFPTHITLKMYTKDPATANPTSKEVQRARAKALRTKAVGLIQKADYYPRRKLP